MKLTKIQNCLKCSTDQLFTQYNSHNRLYFRHVCDKCFRAHNRLMQNPDKQYERPKIDKPDICRTCGEPNKNYSTRLNGKGSRYYNLDCTTCRSQNRNKFIKRLQSTDPERYYRIRRHEQLRSIYKISLVDYEAKLKSQHGGCAICGNSEGARSMPLDHDHTTGVIRSILCHYCNKGLGQFFDDPVKLRAAAEYIERYKNDNISTT